MKQLLLFTAALASALWVWCLPELFVVSPITLTPLDVLPHAPSWFPALDIGSNAWFMWRLDSRASALGSFLMPAIDPLSASALGALGVLAVGIFLLAAVLWRQTPAAALLSAVVGGTVLILILGADPVSLQALMWVPWLALCTGLLVTRRLPFSVAAPCVLLVALFVTGGANQFSFIILPLGVILGGAAGGLSASKLPTPLLGLLVVFGVLTAALAPTPPIPDYPQLSRVMPEDGVPGMERPLLGPDRSIPFINRPFEHDRFALVAVLLTLVAGYLTLAGDRGLRPFAAAGLVLAVVLAFDAGVPERWSIFGPLVALTRLIPGLVFLSLSATILGAAWLSLYLGAVARERLPLLLFLCAAPVALLGVEKGAGWATELGLISHREDRHALAALRNSPLDPNLRRIVVSPSYTLLNAHGLWLVAAALDPAAALPLPAETEVRVSHHGGEKAIARLMDDKNGSRWTPKRGRQLGDEWIALKLPQPMELSIVEVGTGRFRADFPRGLRLRGLARCDGDWAEVLRQSGEVLVDYPRWDGPFSKTPEGYPYLGAQSDVTVHLPALNSVQCLLIEQTGISDNFDWSVTKIRLGHHIPSPSPKKEPEE